MEQRESWHNVGRRIRYLRKINQLTLKQLAAGSGMSPNAISLVERGEVAPTVATLCRIAAALGVPASSFLQEICPNELVLVRAQERNIQYAGQVAVKAMSCSLENTTRLASAPNEKPSDAVRQTVMCLSGTLEYEADGRTCRLKPGDSLTFNARARHHWSNCGAEGAVAVIILPPTDTHAGDPE